MSEIKNLSRSSTQTQDRVYRPQEKAGHQVTRTYTQEDPSKIQEDHRD